MISGCLLLHPARGWFVHYCAAFCYTLPVGVEVLVQFNAAEQAERLVASRKGKQEEQAAAVQGQI